MLLNSTKNIAASSANNRAVCYIFTDNARFTILAHYSANSRITHSSRRKEYRDFYACEYSAL